MTILNGIATYQYLNSITKYEYFINVVMLAVSGKQQIVLKEKDSVKMLFATNGTILVCRVNSCRWVSVDGVACCEGT